MKMSTSLHPQTDGAWEVMSLMLESYVRCYCNRMQNDWDLLLSTAEFAYISVSVEGHAAYPFELDIGWKPQCLRKLLRIPQGSVETVEELLQKLEFSILDALCACKK